MAYFDRTQSLGDTVNRQNLYDLINTCTIGGVAIGAVGGVMTQYTQTEPPSTMTFSSMWYDQKEQLLRLPVMDVAGSPCSLWISVGPDSWEMPVFNNNDYTIPQGALVSWAYSPASGVYDVVLTEPQNPTTSTYFNEVQLIRWNANLRCIAGVVQATMPAQEFGRMVFRGFSYTLIQDTQTKVASNVCRPISVSTMFTGAAVLSDSGTYDADPYCFGQLHVHPAISTVTAPQLYPSFIWLPLNQLNHITKY